MLDKLEAIYKRYLEVEKIISSPDAMKDMRNYVLLTKEYKDLKPIVKTYKEYNSYSKGLSEPINYTKKTFTQEKVTKLISRSNKSF